MINVTMPFKRTVITRYTLTTITNTLVFSADFLTIISSRSREGILSGNCDKTMGNFCSYLVSVCMVLRVFS